MRCRFTPESTPWVWFDLDDTLWDFRGNSHVCLSEVYGEFGLERYFGTVDRWRDCYHDVNHRLWDMYNRAEISGAVLRMERFRLPLVGAGCTDAEARRLSLEMDGDYLGRLGSKQGLVPGAVELLGHIRGKGYRIGMLSNGFREVQHDKLRSSGIGMYFDCVVLSDDIGINKPDARIYAYACSVSGAAPGGSVMIGDNPQTDIAGALASGWEAVLFDPDGRFPDAGVDTVASLCEAAMMFG